MSYRLLKFVLGELEQYKQDRKIKWNDKFVRDLEALKTALKRLLPYF